MSLLPGERDSAGGEVYMKIWFVLIRPRLGVQWIDSTWVTYGAAIERRDEVRRAWAMAGNDNSGHTADVYEGKLQNAMLAVKKIVARRSKGKSV